MDDGQKENNYGKQRLFPPLPPMVKYKPKVYVGFEEEMASNDFDSRSKDKLDIMSNMISVVSLEYDIVTEVIEEGDELAKKMATHGSLHEDKDIFQGPRMLMQQHLKHLYIRAKVEGFGVNKVLIGCGSCIYAIRHSLLKRIGKYDTDLNSNSMVLSNYKGKTNRPFGVIQVDVVVRTTT